jgi:hypothetical protein
LGDGCILIKNIIEYDVNKTKEEEYIEVMRKLQFGTAEVSDKHLFITETENKFKHYCTQTVLLSSFMYSNYSANLPLAISMSSGLC